MRSGGRAIRTLTKRNGSSRDVAPGKARAQRRADARRLDILHAAARVFGERGFAAAGMREIAHAADLSAANLYHYFRGKDEILFFCQEQALERMLAALAEARRSRASVPDRLYELARAHVLCLLDEVFGAAAHLEVDALPPALRAAIVRKRDTYERGVRALIIRGIRGGDLTSSDATISTRAFLGALNWTAQWFRPDGPLAADRVAALVAEYAVRGLTVGRSLRAVGPRAATPLRLASGSNRKSQG